MWINILGIIKGDVVDVIAPDCMFSSNETDTVRIQERRIGPIGGILDAVADIIAFDQVVISINPNSTCAAR